MTGHRTGEGLRDFTKDVLLTVTSSTVRATDGSAHVSNVETWAHSSSSASQSNRPPQRMSMITHNQQNLLKSHQDIVVCLACIDSPFRGGIVSADRAGVIKVWRVGSTD
jgi:phosphoinositide-3-kinase regulatory subunit 4